jgi:TonB-linked SusC/RagA family outer membrane protein
MNGNYSINVTDKAVLIFSYVGFATQEITVGARRTLDVILQEDSQSLDEVVVVGYGSQKKLTLTGAVTAINTKQIVTTKSGNVQNALAGKIAGVKISQRTSEPGVFNGEFSIRGMDAPLFVIDGVPRENMPRMDANDIESISILKDASAAIYGTRAGNGVVLITTKKGANNTKFKMEYNGYVGSETFMMKTKPNDAIGYMTLMNEREYNQNNPTAPFTQTQIDDYRNGTKQSQDWMFQFINEHPIETSHSISASGGTDKVKYFTNFGYFNQEGMWASKAASYDRFNLRSNITAELAKGLTGEVFLNLMKDHRNRQAEDSWRTFDGVWGQIPINPVFIDDDRNYPGNAANSRHAYIMTTPSLSGYNWYEQRHVQTNLALNWEIPWVKGLTARGMYSYDYLGYEDKTFRVPEVQYNPDKTIGNVNNYIPITRTYVGMTNTLLQLQLSYSKSINLHNINAVALYEESDRQSDNFRAQRDGTIFTVEQLFSGSSSTQQASQNTNMELDPNTSVSVLHHFVNKAIVGRLAYDYASKYIAEFSFRYDGSSKFAPEHQWGFFPSVSGGWRVSEENFFKDNIPQINNLKVRASYGVLGDDGKATYQFYSGYDYPVADNGYIFGGKIINGINMRGIPNTLLSWISSKMIDIGVDAEAWNGLLGASVDVFRRDRTGLMATRQITLPGEVGANFSQENLNSDVMKGLEITLTHRHKIGSDFKYNASVNMAFDRTQNKHVERAESGNSYRNWRDNNTNRLTDIHWGYDYLGQYQNFDQIFGGPVYENGNAYMLPGDLMWDDWNEDGIIDANDEHPIAFNAKRDGKMKPLLTYGATLGAEYKGFDFTAVFQGIGTAYRRDNDPDIFEYPLSGGNAASNGLGNGWSAFMDRWHRADETNPTKWQDWVPGKYPSTYKNNNRGFIVKNSFFWIYDGQYLRVKSLELGYTIPKRLTQKLAIERTRFFFNGFNLFTFSKMETLDPEQPERYPLNKSLNFGVSVQF